MHHIIQNYQGMHSIFTPAHSFCIATCCSFMHCQGPIRAVAYILIGAYTAAIGGWVAGQATGAALGAALRLVDRIVGGPGEWATC